MGAQMLFQRMEQDGAASLAVEEVVAWFVEVREMVRQRELAERICKLPVPQASQTKPSLQRQKSKRLASKGTEENQRGAHFKKQSPLEESPAPTPRAPLSRAQSRSKL